MMDYFIMKPIIRRFPSSRIVAKNKTIRKELELLGVKTLSWPSFPDVVVMARHAMHEFPIKNVVKVGMNHGPYIFKDFIGAKKYNAFHRFLMTSPEHVALGEKVGIKSGVAIGYPKLDQAFNGEITEATQDVLRKSLHFDPEKPAILFSSTWDKSSMSAIDIWHSRVEELSSSYNVMVTVHPFMSDHYKESLKAKHNISYIESSNIIPYLMLADVLISDTSSIIAEYCSLDKPIVTFRVDTGKRLKTEIKDLIATISTSVTSFEEMETAITLSLKNDMLTHARQAANKRFFLALDGKAAERAAAEILDVLKAQRLKVPDIMEQQ